MDDIGDSTLAQRNGNANARCEWALMRETMQNYQSAAVVSTRTSDQSENRKNFAVARKKYLAFFVFFWGNNALIQKI